VDIPRHVTLDFNGAKIVPSAAYDVLFVGLGATVKDAWIDCGTIDYTGATAITLDTNETGSAYRGNSGTEVTVEGRILGSTGFDAQGPTGTGVKLVSDGNAITLGNRFTLTVVGFDTGIDTTAPNGGFINGNTFDVTLINQGTNQWYHRAGPLISHITGYMQPDGTNGTAYGFRNTGNNTSGPYFRGVLYDISSYTTNAIVGGGTFVTTIDPASGLAASADGAFGQTIMWLGDQRIGIVDPDNGDTYALHVDSNALRFEVDGTEYWAMNNDGVLYSVGDSGQFMPPKVDDPTDAENRSLFEDPSADALKYKTSSGTVITL